MTTQSQSPVILWFRQDLRVADHRAMSAAVAAGAPVIPVYILDDASAADWPMGATSRWWLHHSLVSLAASLEKLGVKLVLRRGEALKVLAAMARETGASAVYCTRCYEPWAAKLEGSLKLALERDGVELKRFAGSLLREPEDVRTQGGDHFKVYTPFWRALVAKGTPAAPLPAPKKIKATEKTPASDALDAWELLPAKPDWAGGLREHWQPGESGAQKRLQRFLQHALKTYTEDRNRPDMEGTSRLSPHMHFGEISPHQCWHAAVGAAEQQRGADKGLETFCKELVWREFAYQLLVHHPHLPEKPIRADFARFPWRKDKTALRAWQKGQTGYPIVDAGMRELWHTGYMHNRVRMIVASFLVKHLLIPWQEGEAWFWDTLVDADLANNAASWQWVAGSGADAAPYFRIFAPVTQGEKFDPNAAYVRRWVPEIAKLPDAVIHAPWTAPEAILKAAGVVLGKTYPLPIVDHAAARKRALDSYEQVKAANTAAQ
jgi:deoxyribodipyrimidine photo-lyase